MAKALAVANIWFDITGTNRVDFITGNICRFVANSIAVPSGTNAQKPVGSAGVIRYNSETSKFEFYDSSWKNIASNTEVEAASSVGASSYTAGNTNYTYSANNVMLAANSAYAKANAALANSTTTYVGELSLAGNISLIAANTSFNVGTISTLSKNPGVSSYSNTNYGVYGLSNTWHGTVGMSYSGYGAQGISNTSFGSYGISYSNVGIFGSSNTGPGARGISYSGNGVIGISNTNTGVFGFSYSAAGVNGQSITAAGVVGNSSSNYGVAGFSTNSYGVYGISTSQDGIHGTSTDGYGVYGESTNNNGVNAYSTNGVALYANAPNNWGVYATSAASTAAYFQTSAGSGYGLYVESYGNYGIYGKSLNTTYAGVIGVSQNGTTLGRVGHNNNYAFHGTGALTITGALSKGSGTFVIDHPLDPLNKNLVHGFIEGPRYDLLYRGKVTLKNGTAVVDIDAASNVSTGTFAALTINAEVTSLLNKSTFDRVLASDIINGKFTITSENANSSATIVWVAIAERNDIFIKNNPNTYTDTDGRMVPEQDKPV